MSSVKSQEHRDWHCHILIKFNNVNEIWISSSEIEKMWGNGTGRVTAIKRKVRDLGNYLSSYFGDIELNLENVKLLKKLGKNIKDFKETEGAKKKFIKGGRLYLYPTGMRIYRKSKGIKEPGRFYDLYSKRDKIIGLYPPVYEENIKIIDDDKELFK